MLPFHVELHTGESPYRQVVYAAKRAIVSGRLPRGASFPSVRELSRELRINPNTAHKVVAALVQEGLLEVLPGVGTVVAAAGTVDPAARTELLDQQVEELIVEAMHLDLSLDEVLRALKSHWQRLHAGRAGEGGSAAAPKRTGARQ